MSEYRGISVIDANLLVELTKDSTLVDKLSIM